MTNDHSAVRTAASGLLEVLDRVGDDVGAAEGEIEAIMKELLLVDWLDDVDATPAGGDVDDDVSTGWLYQDGDLRIVRGRMRAGFSQEPHDHGAWNIFAVYRGAVITVRTAASTTDRAHTGPTWRWPRTSS